MMRLIKYIIFFLLAVNLYSATLHVGSGQTYTTVGAGIAAMSGGDTLYIHNGTYTGTDNDVTAVPSGTYVNDTGWNTLQATPLFPLAIQDSAKAIMGRYTAHSVNGARGWAGSAQTLSEYILEALGNQWGIISANMRSGGSGKVRGGGSGGVR